MAIKKTSDTKKKTRNPKAKAFNKLMKGIIRGRKRIKNRERSI